MNGEETVFGEKTALGNEQTPLNHEHKPVEAAVEVTQHATHVVEAAVVEASPPLAQVVLEVLSTGPSNPAVAAESSTVETEEVRKRPHLNPSVEDHQTRAVGSIGAEVETEAVALAAAAAAQTEAALSSRAPLGQIELPPKQLTLDDGLEQ